MHWRRKWQPTPVFLPGESQGQRSLVGCIVQTVGSHRVGHDWSDLTAAAAGTFKMSVQETYVQVATRLFNRKWMNVTPCLLLETKACVNS